MKKENNNLLKSIIIGATILSIGVSSYVKPAYGLAEENAKVTVSAHKCRKEKHEKILKDCLKELVKEEKLSKDKADKVLSYIKENKGNKHDSDKKDNNPNSPNSPNNNNPNDAIRVRRNLFDEMVNKNIITQQEADAIRDKKMDKIMEMRKEKIEDALEELVEDKIITKEQEEKFLERLDKQVNEFKELHKKLRNMPIEERKDYIIKNNLKGQDLIEQMVKEGIITEEQAKAVREAMPKPHEDKCKTKEKRD